MMHAVQKCLCQHLALAGSEVAEPEIFALLPVARLGLDDELLQLLTRLVTDTEQFINGLWGKPLPIEVRQIENEVSKKKVRGKKRREQGPVLTRLGNVTRLIECFGMRRKPFLPAFRFSCRVVE